MGQPIIDEIRKACADSWLFEGCGERWLFESDGIAGCGKTSAAYVTARALGVSDFAIERIDSRAYTVADLRALDGSMRSYGMGSENGRRCYIIDEIQHLNRDCLRMLLGLLENLPSHVLVIGTTTSTDWADDVDGLYSRWRRFRFRNGWQVWRRGRASLVMQRDRAEGPPASWSVAYVAVRAGAITCSGARVIQGRPPEWDAPHSLTQETIGKRIESSADRFDLKKVFRKRRAGRGYEMNPAWGTMVQPASKGCYRLVPPESA